ncbi:hypothetical protein PS627_02683 [Pseudomonas fluorescens]|uniref:glycosyltransferase n=1 Tax=Pseudomonas fluorescens TaxID=294 RepID=UPI00125B2E63|nr:glycosyltransferase [Pseudomonas fluorescens]CAG8867922.1 hypothetical protein PS627_02683 [Pseudomonas fluorescens]VVP81314.1 hypothetical protein PS910_01986 [Pseudomonas fluorescens]
MIDKPRASVVIPAFNPRFFTLALQSALAQSQQGLEVLVCDDSEGDEIEAIVRSLQGQGSASLRYVRNPRRLGFVANLVQAVELAQGEFVKVLCDDDRLLPQCVARQVQVLQEQADVGLVLAQRVYADASNYILPMRLSNARFANVDSLFKGADILSMLDGRGLNFLGNFSAALMRREEALELLRALTGEGQGFNALLDQALFICLMRRANMVMLTEVLLIERLHPERLSKQPDSVLAAKAERGWLQQMLAQRTGEQAPANGWVRLVPLAQAQLAPRPWQEVNMVLQLGNWQTCMLGRVGTDSESYDELYQQWLAERCLTPAQRRMLPQTLAAWPRQPRIVPVLLDPEGDAEGVRQTLASLESQIYPARHCVVLSSSAPTTSLPVTCLALDVNWPGQLNGLLADLHDADWIYLLRAGDRLAESALLVLAERIAVLPGITCAYSDEGAWLDERAVEPVFKPDFNLDLLRSYPYVGRTLAFDCEAARALGGFDAQFGELAAHDLLWRLVETGGPQVVDHIAELQVQSAFTFAQWLSQGAVAEQNSRVVQAHLDRLGVRHHLHPADLPMLNRVEYLHEQQPLVSIIVVCADDLATLQQCVMSVIEHTAYPRYELLLVAGEQVNAATRSWLQAMSGVCGAMLRVLQVPASAPVALIGAAASEAHGEYLLTLSPRLQVFQAQWLDEMMLHAQRPEVAVVGAKVVDAFGKIVHAGLVMGGGDAVGSVCVGEDGMSRGYLQRLQVVQNWTVLSGDCLLVRKAVVEELGGLDGQTFDWGLGELDLCLKARQIGYLAVWTPYARLQGVARAASLVPGEQLQAQQLAFFERWLPFVARDPAYNSNLGLMTVNYSVDPGQRFSWNPLCARAVPSVLGLPINSSAVGTYRVIQPLLALQAAGQVIGRIAYEAPTIVQLARMDPDVVILQLRHNHEAVQDIERIARFSNARRIFEIDDYVLQAPSKNSHARNKPSDIEHHLRRGIGLCDRVVVTTDALANALSGMHRDIRVVPNMLDPNPWLTLQSRRGVGAKPRVGWGGGTSHGGDLEIIADVVRALADQVEWVFFGMCPEALKPYIHEFHPVVNLPLYPAKLASLNLDLALAPLEFHIFNDCKSNLRLLEYGACGYPVICSDTAAYQGDLPCTRIRSNSSEEWLQAIRQHLGDPVASYRLGDELREAVRRDFMLRDHHLQQWVHGWLAD